MSILVEVAIAREDLSHDGLPNEQSAQGLAGVVSGYVVRPYADVYWSAVVEGRIVVVVVGGEGTWADRTLTLGALGKAPWAECHMPAVVEVGIPIVWVMAGRRTRKAVEALDLVLRERWGHRRPELVRMPGSEQRRV